jgi:hypothetical protein
VDRTLAAAADWVDEVGLALLFPKADVVLPSLWEQVAGDAAALEGWTPELAFLWATKDDLPAQGLVCVGKHLARVTTLVAPRLVPVLVAANGEDVDDDPVVDAIRELGPLSGPQLREATGLPKKEVDRRIGPLHRALVLTHSHAVERETAWSSVAHDVLARKWRLPRQLPDPAAARREVAGVVLEQAGELTAADLRGVVGWRPKECAAVLEEVAESREQGGFRIWARP